MIFDMIGIIMSVIALVIGIYYYLMSWYNFWKSRGIPGPQPIPIFGTAKDMILGKKSIASYLKTVYEQYPNEPMIGIYAGREPILLLNDMELIKCVLIKDFKSFVNRGLPMYEKHEPLSPHLVNLEPKRWRPLRTKLTPVFSSGKLKQMFYLLIECANQLEKYLNQVNNKVVNIGEITAKFGTDVIGVCAFGLQTNALADEDSIFRQMGKRVFKTNFKRTLQMRLRRYAPSIYNFFGSWLTDRSLNDFFTNLTKDTVEYRKKNNIVRHDFIDLLTAIKNESTEGCDIEFTDKLMVAQLYVFFVAGFETSSTATSNCLFELAMNHSIRDKLHKEIKDELERTNGNITYDGIKSMKYLDKVVNETLRKYPPITFLLRKSMTPYTFPGTNVTLPLGTAVYIPTSAIQRDPKYYPNPDVFDPERFSDEAKKYRPPMSFLAFGKGPRNCIGERFGQMQTKVAIIKILQNHTVDVCEQTNKKNIIIPNGFLLTTNNGIFVKLLKQ